MSDKIDIGQMEYVAIDVETTSPRPESARIIEIGVVEFDAAGERTNAWHTLVNPGMGKRITNADIHGITGADVKEAPTFEDIAEKVATSTYGRVTVAHNAAYDVTVLREEFNRVGLTMPELPVVCTMKMCHDLDLELTNHQLASVAALLNLPVGRGHAALHDAALTTAIFASQLDLIGIRGVRELRAWEGPKEPLGEWLPRRLDPNPAPTLKEREGIAADDVHRFPLKADPELLVSMRRTKFAASQSRAASTTCPKCSQGKLVLKSRRDGSGQFRSCSRYPNCKYATDA